MSEKEIVKPFVDKIKQDKLDQRRTVLSEVDQAFVNAVAVVADATGVALEPSVEAIVQDIFDAEEEQEPEIRPSPDATNAVLKDFMDDQGIDYDSDDTKADFNEKIDAWVDAQHE